VTKKKIKPPALFGVVPPGMEAVLRDELASHGFRSLTVKPGGVEFRGSPLKANRVLACASRVLQPLTRYQARDFDALIAGADALDWTPYGGVTVTASSTRSRLYHTDAVVERLSALLPAGPTRLHCRLVHDRCTLKIDTSGEHLHRRGWRLETGPAPLRETLAARILRLAGWRPGEALVDPMCGSGTFVIEAAVQAAGLVPGRLRSFACERWWRTELMPKGVAVPTVIAGSDRAQSAIRAAQGNAERAGVDVQLQVAQAQTLTPPAPTGLVVVNPPYDRRAQGQKPAWTALRQMLTGPFAGWRAAVLCPAPHLAERLGRPIAQRHRVKNGGVPLTVLILDA
jgi:putative N6-adenine-specific DNA methylase